MTTRLGRSLTLRACTHCTVNHISAVSAPNQRPDPAAYPTVNLSGFDVPCPTYDHTVNQIYSGPATQYNTHHTLPLKVFSPEQNKVFVYDGYLWNEFDLENVFSCNIPCQGSQGGGDVPGNQSPSYLASA